jgi:hypothetical protein
MQDNTNRIDEVLWLHCTRWTEMLMSIFDSGGPTDRGPDVSGTPFPIPTRQYEYFISGPTNSEFLVKTLSALHR